MNIWISIIYRHLFKRYLTLLVFIGHWNHIFGHGNNVSEINGVRRIVDRWEFIFGITKSLRTDVQVKITFVIIDGAEFWEETTPTFLLYFIFAVKIVTFPFIKISTNTFIQVFEQNILEIFYHDFISLHPCFGGISFQLFIDGVALLWKTHIGFSPILQLVHIW